MQRADGVVREVGAAFAELSGREFGVIQTDFMEDAEFVVVVAGSTAGNTRHVARQLRAQGVKAGVVKVRVFRPFPVADMIAALSGAKAVAVLDRADSFGAEGGPLFLETRSALYDAETRPAIVNYVYGLGGADVQTGLIERVYNDLADIASGTPAPEGLVYLGAR
jgi:pyruvate ferredoxin oxidoreductase alpha subunit